MHHHRSPGTVLILGALLALSACGTAPSAGSVSGNPISPPPAGSNPTPDPPAASLELPEIESGFPAACGMVTSDELAAIVGNPLGDGGGFGNLVCDWQSDGTNETGVGLLLQPLPAQFCPDGLPEGDATDQFGSPASIHYDDIGDVPGAQVGVCVDAGMVLVTVTGGYRAASDKERYTGEAVEVMELILGRL